jgi:hypothetical protein
MKQLPTVELAGLSLLQTSQYGPAETALRWPVLFSQRQVACSQQRDVKISRVRMRH